MTGYHTRWVQPDADESDQEQIAIQEALAFGKAVYDRRTAVGMTIVHITAGHDLGSVSFQNRPA